MVEGNLWDIQEHFSSSDRSSQFMITDATGHAVQILCRYNGPGLVQGERARVRYVAYNSRLLEMDMLSGPFQTWHLRESSGENAYWGFVVIGVFFGLFAYHQFAKLRLAEDDGNEKA